MSFSGFEQTDFNVFSIDGLDERMDALKKNIRPKLTTLGEEIAPYLSEKTNLDIHFHVAKHARRKVNPPDDTWVAFANNKRGYKKLPHFQIGLFGSHLFVWFAVIYESPVKDRLGEVLSGQIEDIQSQVPDNFLWSVDHMKPDAEKHSEVTDKDMQEMFERLQNVKKAELLCGIHIQNNDPLLQDGEALKEKIKSTFDTLLPLYKTAMRVYENEV